MWTVASDGLIVHRYEPDAPLPPGAEPPTPVPTATHTPTLTPTITPTPTPTRTPTPTGPWLRINWAGGASELLVGAHGASARRVTAAFGNMPASATITGTIQGAATFAGGETAFSSTVFPVAGAGEFPFVLEAAPGSVPGQPFTVRLSLGGATAERTGRVAWRLALPLLQVGGR